MHNGVSGRQRPEGETEMGVEKGIRCYPSVPFPRVTLNFPAPMKKMTSAVRR